MKKIVSITDLFGNPVNLEHYDIIHIGKDSVLAQFKGYGFTKMFAPYDGYTVVIVEE